MQSLRCAYKIIESFVAECITDNNFKSHYTNNSAEY